MTCRQLLLANKNCSKLEQVSGTQCRVLNVQLQLKPTISMAMTETGHPIHHHRCPQRAVLGQVC